MTQRARTWFRGLPTAAPIRRSGLALATLALASLFAPAFALPNAVVLPEPSTALLLGAGLAVQAAVRRRTLRR
jgi:hypothetical protein